MWGTALALGLGSLGGSALAAGGASKSARHQTKRQQKYNLANYRRMLADWQKYAFPNAGAIQAMQQGVAADKMKTMNVLGQAYQNLPQKVFSQSAARGFGPGSGLTMKSLGNVEGSYLNALSQMFSNFGKLNADVGMFANTPRYSPPTISGMTVGQVPQQSTSFWGQGSDMLGTAAGYMMMNQLLNGGGGFPSTTSGAFANNDFSTPYGIQFGVANPRYGKW